MKRTESHDFFLALSVLAVLQIGFFVAAQTVFALPPDGEICMKCSGGGGGSKNPPQTQKLIQTSNAMDECGNSTVGTVTTISQLINGTYRLVQVIQDMTVTSTLSNTTDVSHEVTDYERDLDGVLRGVIGSREGTITSLYDPNYVTTYSEGKTYNLYEEEVAKLAKVTYRSESNDPYWDMTQTFEQTLDYEYYTDGGLYDAKGGFTAFITSDKGLIQTKEGGVYQFSFINGNPLLTHVEIHDYTKNNDLTQFSPSSSDMKYALDYSYDSYGGLINATMIFPGIQSLTSTGWGGPMGATETIFEDFVIVKGVPLPSHVNVDTTSWDRVNQETCASAYDGNNTYNECGILQWSESSGWINCVIKGGTGKPMKKSSPKKRVIGAACTTSLDSVTKTKLDTLKMIMRPEIIKPKVEIRLGYGSLKDLKKKSLTSKGKPVATVVKPVASKKK